jgi:hypothetical protein
MFVKYFYIDQFLIDMNVLSKSYTDVFENTNHLLNRSPLVSLMQCTSVGEGCAAAFYFNYAKLLSSLSGITNNKILSEKFISLC